MPTSEQPALHAVPRDCCEVSSADTTEASLSQFDYEQMCTALAAVAQRIQELKKAKQTAEERHEEELHENV